MQRYLGVMMKDAGDYRAFMSDRDFDRALTWWPIALDLLRQNTYRYGSRKGSADGLFKIFGGDL